MLETRREMVAGAIAVSPVPGTDCCMLAPFRRSYPDCRPDAPCRKVRLHQVAHSARRAHARYDPLLLLPLGNGGSRRLAALLLEHMALGEGAIDLVAGIAEGLGEGLAAADEGLGVVAP